jgi:hypothetical protein
MMRRRVREKRKRERRKNNKRKTHSSLWWPTPAISPRRKLKNKELEAILSYIMRSCLRTKTQGDTQTHNHIIVKFSVFRKLPYFWVNNDNRQSIQKTVKLPKKVFKKWSPKKLWIARHLILNWRQTKYFSDKQMLRNFLYKNEYRNLKPAETTIRKRLR